MLPLRHFIGHRPIPLKFFLKAQSIYCVARTRSRQAPRHLSQLGIYGEVKGFPVLGLSQPPIEEVRWKTLHYRPALLSIKVFWARIGQIQKGLQYSTASFSAVAVEKTGVPGVKSHCRAFQAFLAYTNSTVRVRVLQALQPRENCGQHRTSVKPYEISRENGCCGKCSEMTKAVPVLG